MRLPKNHYLEVKEHRKKTLFAQFLKKTFLFSFSQLTPFPCGAMLYQLSYEATHWERGQFIEFISPVRSEMM